MSSMWGQEAWRREKRLRCTLLLCVYWLRSNMLLRINFLKFSSTLSFLVLAVALVQITGTVKIDFISRQVTADLLILCCLVSKTNFVLCLDKLNIHSVIWKYVLGAFFRFLRWCELVRIKSIIWLNISDFFWLFGDGLITMIKMHDCQFNKCFPQRRSIEGNNAS